MRAFHVVRLSIVASVLAGALVLPCAAGGETADMSRKIESYGAMIATGTLAPEEMVSVRLNRALAYQTTGRLVEALNDYTAALEMDVMANDLRSVALYNRGLTYHKMGDRAHAIEDYTAALLLNAELPQAFLSRGQALRENGQLLFALSDFERALKFGHPQKAKVHYIMALTYEQMQRPFEAQREYAEAIAQDPSQDNARTRMSALNLPARPAVETKTAVPASGHLDVVRADLPAAIPPTDELLAEGKPDVAPAVPVISKSVVERLPPPAGQDTADVTGSITPATPAKPSSEKEATSKTELAALAEDSSTYGQAEAIAASEQWAVQLSSASSESGAWASWERMQKRSKALAGLKPQVVRADLGAKGIFYRVRLTGYKDAAAAKAACGKLKSAGVTCFASVAG